MLKKSNFTIIFLITIISSGCLNTNTENEVKEGHIIYKVKSTDEQNWISYFAPHEMKLSFSDGLYVAEMSSMGGIFQSRIIANTFKNNLIQTVKVWTDKMYSEQSDGELLKENTALMNYSLVLTDEEKDIAGYTCVKTLAINLQSKDTVILWTSEKIGLKYPEFALPFKGIKGFPMVYSMTKFGIELEFEAKKVKAEKVDKSKFEIPIGYKKVQADSLTHYFLKFKS